MSSSSGESWSTSDDNSSGNEYSVRTKQDKLAEQEQQKQKKKIRKIKRKKRKKEKKNKKNKYKSDDSDTDSEIHNKKDCKEKNNKDIIKNDDLKNGRIKKGPRTPSPPPPRRRSPDRSILKKRSQSRSSSKERRISKKESPSRSRSTEKRRLRSLSPASSNIRKNSKSPSRNPSTLDNNKSKIISSRNKPSQYRSRSPTRSKSRERSRSRGRKSSCAYTRSRSRSRNRSRSRGRYQNSRFVRRSPSRDRSYQNYNRSYDRYDRGRYRERSRSRDKGVYKRSRSRSRGKRIYKSRSRSRDRRRSRSRSKSYERRKQKSRSPSPRKNTIKSRSPIKSPPSPKPKVSSWDVKHVPDDKTNIETSSNSQNSLDFKGTEIKQPDPVTANDKDKEETKSKLYGKWETYVPPAKSNRDLSKFTKMCQEISAKEGIEEVQPKDLVVKEEPVHHPFSVKQAPIYTPQNFPLKPPTTPAQAIMAGSLVSLMAPVSDPPLSGPLEKHFPVSSGTDHRKISDNISADMDAVVFEEKAEEPINVSGVIARRLGAQQILTANPNDISAKLVMAECDVKLKKWSDHNKKPGKFTGEVGVKMNKKEMFTVGGHDTIQKDFFHNLRPVTGGIGMKMLQNMGWKEGQPLGKNMQGFITPISIDVKVGRAGLSAEEELPRFPQYQQFNQNNRPMGKPQPMPKKKPPTPIQNIGGKHPVSTLAEICTKRKMGIPEYSVVMESGHSYAKIFLMKVLVESVAYQPSETSPNKKHAKALAATLALKHLGITE